MTASFHPPQAQDATGTTNSEGQPTGLWSATYPDGSKASEIFYDEFGNPLNTATQWYTNGEPMLELNFSRQGAEAVQRTYYPDGKRQSEQTLAHGMPHGPIKAWDPNGALVSEGSFHMGRLHGSLKETFPGGSSEESYSFGVAQQSGFQMASLFQGGLLSLLLLIVVAIGLIVAVAKEAGAIHGLLILSIVLVLHEFGHWWVAKWVGIPIQSFRIGIGPHIASFFWRRTLFEIHLIPLIGWVKQVAFWPGEWEQFQKTEKERSVPAVPTFSDVPQVPEPPVAADKFFTPAPRIAFFLGGIAMNLLSAFVVIWLTVYPARPDRAFVSCAQVSAKIVTVIPMAVVEQFNPKNFVEDQPGLLRGVRDGSREGVSFGKQFAFISILIAVFNLLPFPPLDGFHISMATTEKLLGRELPNGLVNGVMRIGVGVLLLMLITGVFFLGRDLIQMLRGY